MACGMLLTGLLVAWVCKRARPVYLVAYHVFKPPDWCAHVPTVCEPRQCLSLLVLHRLVASMTVEA